MKSREILNNKDSLDIFSPPGGKDLSRKELNRGIFLGLKDFPTENMI